MASPEAPRLIEMRHPNPNVNMIVAVRETMAEVLERFGYERVDKPVDEPPDKTKESERED